MLDQFFSPKSVAVIGASREEGKVGHDIMKNLLQNGFAGKVYPINPKADSIMGLKAYPSIKAVGDGVDMAVVVIPAQFVLSAVDECAAKGVKALIIISAGFKESGPEGAERERQLIQKIRQHNIRIVGPNCLGLIDTQSKLNASFAKLMALPGNIAFFSQSGALCSAILDWSLHAGIGFSKFVSMGNKTDVDELDLIRAVGEDENTQVVLGYIEGVKSGRELMRVARDVTRRKPVIMVKSGGTAAGARAASSHTGALAGSESAFNAAFAQCGILRAATMENLFDYALAFSYQGGLRGPNIALITNAGGPGIIATDAVERSSLKMASFTKETIDALREALPHTANVYNPVDVIGDAKADRYKIALDRVIADPNVHSVLVILTPQAMTEAEKTAEVTGAAADASDKPIVASFIGGPGMAAAIKILAQHKVPNYEFPERAVSAVDAMYRHVLWSLKPHEEVRSFSFDKHRIRSILEAMKQARRPALGEQEAREIVAACGFELPSSLLAKTAPEAVAAAESIGFPVVMKIASPDILHKSDIGGVRVGLRNEAEVTQAFGDMMGRVRRRMPQADIRGVLVQQMVRGGKEVILGMTRDPQFGPMLMFGLGGIYVEVLKDVTFRIAPITPSDAEGMIRELRSFPLLRGARGEKPSDLNAIVASLLRLSQLVTEFPALIEMDINPLIVFPEGQGAVALDARMTIALEG